MRKHLIVLNAFFCKFECLRLIDIHIFYLIDVFHNNANLNNTKSLNIFSFPFWYFFDTIFNITLKIVLTRVKCKRHQLKNICLLNSNDIYICNIYDYILFENLYI